MKIKVRVKDVLEKLGFCGHYLFSSGMAGKEMTTEHQFPEFVEVEGFDGLAADRWSPAIAKHFDESFYITQQLFRDHASAADFLGFKLVSWPAVQDADGFYLMKQETK